VLSEETTQSVDVQRHPGSSPSDNIHGAIHTSTMAPLQSHASQEYDTMDPSVASFMAAQDKRQSRLDLDHWARLLVTLGDAQSMDVAMTAGTTTTSTMKATAEPEQVPVPTSVPTPNLVKKSPTIDKLICTSQTELLSNGITTGMEEFPDPTVRSEGITCKRAEGGGGSTRGHKSADNVWKQQGS